MALQTQLCPPLENGDRLSYREFERRYAAMPQHQKAELVEGVVYMASPLRFTHSCRTPWSSHYLVRSISVRYSQRSDGH